MRKPLFLFISALGIITSGAVLAAPRTVTLDVPTMTCPLCPITIMKSLDRVSGVRKVSVDYESKTATVQFDDAVTTAGQLTEATKSAGYPSTVRNDLP